jgi:GTPase SAR1 family protein
LDLGHTYTADLNNTVSRWSNLPSVFNCLKNDVISNPTSLDAEAAEYFHTCTTIRQKAELAVLGKAKAGKSTFINALVGRSVLPVHSDVCTATIIKLSFPTDGRTEGFSVQYKSSDALDSYMAGLRVEEVRYKADCDYATTEWLRSEISSDTKEKICQPYEKHVLYIAKIQEAIAQTSKVLNGTEFIGDLNRLSHYADGTDDNFVPVLVDTIHMYVLSDILQYVSLVDTPGMGDNNEARNNASQRVLNSVDGYVYIVSAQEMKTADVRKELEWIRVVAGAIPHVKLLSRMNEFTSWRLNPIKSKRSKDIDSALMERRKEYNSFDRGRLTLTFHHIHTYIMSDLPSTCR